MLTVSKIRHMISSLLDPRRESETAIDTRPAPKLARLKKREAYRGDPDEILGMDWLTRWSELK